MSRIILLITCCFTITALSAQRAPDEMAAVFFEDFRKDKGQAIKNIYDTSPWMARATDAIQNLVSEVDKLTPEYVGKLYGHSLICRKELADCFVLQSYLLRFDRQPIRFTFEFYKPDKEWMLFSLAFDVNIDDEIEEAAKAFYLPLDK
jgi:hypothetical protein